jgi:hypothetical protein
MVMLQPYLPWLWLALGMLLVSLEVIVPGVHFLWFGIAAILVAGTIFTGMIGGFEWQLLAFALLSLGSLWTGRRLATGSKVDADAATLNEPALRYVGRRVVVEDAIVAGRGRVRVGDTIWQAEGADAPAGAQVVVTSTRGTVLIVAAQ